MPRIYTLFLSLLIVVAANARITGCVTDSIGEPLAGATVSLFQQGDSLIVDAMSADEQGRFSFDATKAGKAYRVAATCLGYKPVEADGLTDGQSVDLRLNDGELHALAELTVTAAKPTVKRELGSFRISPNSYVSLANNSYDLLGLMPLISRSPGGKYSIWGAGAATIYLNGRRPIMSQEQLKIYLQSVPAQNIKEIVIIQDSGASQRGPIINVILDKPDEGFLGNVSAWLWAGQDIFPTGNVMAYYAKDRIAFSAAVFGRVSNQTWESQTDVDFRESGELQNQYNKSRSVNNAVNTEFQLQYTINSKSYVGAFAHIRNIFNSSRHASEVHTYLPDGSEDVYSSGNKTSDRKHYMPTSVVATYHLDLDKRGSYLEATADVNYNQSRQKKEWWGSNIENTNEYYDYKLISSGLKANLMKNYSFGRLDAGYSFVNCGLSDMTADNSQARTDDYHYREFLHRAYISFMHKPADWVEYTVGTKAEYIDQHIDQRIDADFTKSHHFDALPYVSASFFLPKAGQQIKADYKMELERPLYSMLNPVKKWNSENSYSQGNPNLKSSKVHIGSLYYMWNYTLYGHLLFNYVDDFSQAVIRPAGDGVTVNTYDNFGSLKLTQILIGFQKMFFSRWQVSASTSALYRNVDGGDVFPELKSVSWNWGLNIINYIVLSQRHRLTASLDYQLSSPSRTLYDEYRWNNKISLRIEKQFGRDWNVSLTAENFLPRNKVTIRDTPELYYKSRILTSEALVVLSARYSFGNNSVRRARGSRGGAGADRN